MIILLVPAVSFGDECVEGDCVNGKGTMVFSTGHKYTGGFKDGVRHGEGVLLMPGNRKIVGVWAKDFRFRIVKHKFGFTDCHMQYFQASASRISRTNTRAASDLPYGTTQTLSSTSKVDPSE